MITTKHNNSCLDKASDDEPIFVIRAQDKSAAALVQMWMNMNPQVGPEKSLDARDTMEAMRKWPTKKSAT